MTDTWFERLMLEEEALAYKLTALESYADAGYPSSSPAHAELQFMQLSAMRIYLTVLQMRIAQVEKEK